MLRTICEAGEKALLSSFPLAGEGVGRVGAVPAPNLFFRQALSRLYSLFGLIAKNDRVVRHLDAVEFRQRLLGLGVGSKFLRQVLFLQLREERGWEWCALHFHVVERHIQVATSQGNFE